MDHLTEEQAKNYLYDKYPYEELLKLSEHLYFCERCRLQVMAISPNFFKNADESYTRNEAVRTGDSHYSIEQLNAYIAGGFTKDMRYQIVDHIMKCHDCALVILKSEEGMKRFIWDCQDKEEAIRDEHT